MKRFMSVIDWRFTRFPPVAKLIRVLMHPRIYLDKLFRMLLYHIFRFDKWHASILKHRIYALDIIRYCNSLKPDKQVLEIGCGLGDIIRNVKALRSYGYDRDVNVLKAAAFLSFFRPGRISFSRHEFPEDEIKGHYDVIILVNWIHDIVPSVLKQKIHEIFSMNLNMNGEIIVDTVHEEEYMFNHDINFLVDGIDCISKKLGAYDHSREIWVIKKQVI